MTWPSGLTENLLGGHPLRNAEGGDNGVRVLDVDNDGYMDAVIASDADSATRIWNPATRQWQETSFPVALVHNGGQPPVADNGVRFGVLRPDGRASVLMHAEQQGVWHYVDGQWVQDASARSASAADAHDRRWLRSGGADCGTSIWMACAS